MKVRAWERLISPLATFPKWRDDRRGREGAKTGGFGWDIPSICPSY